MNLLEVKDERTVELFHEVPAGIYRRDPDWVPHVAGEIERVFDRERNGGSQNGDARRWVLLNRNFEPVGRIAAFYSAKEGNYEKMGGIGFYECVAEDDCAALLFERAESWLKIRGLEGADGPVNFGERHQFWGCRTWGRSEPVYQENYNPPYYESQFARNGYRPLFESLTYEIGLADHPAERLQKLCGRSGKTDFSFRHYRMNEAGRFVEDYLAIASKAFNLNNRTVKIDRDAILHQLNIQKAVLREDLIWFAYHLEKPVGVIAFMLNWSGILNAALQFNAPRRKKSLKGFLLAVVPEYHRSGVLAGLLHHAGRAVTADETIDRVFACGIAGHSKNVHSLLKKFNADPVARHLTFRKYFDGRPVQAYPLYIDGKG
jgi:hypothetical protein